MAKRQRSKPQEPTVDEVLAALRISNHELKAADRRRDDLVAKARTVGASWTQIARALDMSQQGAHGRWRER